MTSPFFFRSRWMWRIRNMSRESHVSQHERILPMYVQRRICWRRSGVCWRHSVQTGERQKTDHNDRGRSWRRSPFYHCFDSVLLLCKKTKGRGERRNHRENGIYAFWIWKWLAKFWRFRIRLKQFLNSDLNSVTVFKYFRVAMFDQKTGYVRANICLSPFFHEEHAVFIK